MMSSKTIRLFFHMWKKRVNSLDKLGQNKYLNFLPETFKQLSQKWADSFLPFSLPL